uniref:Uncharacterized protein n=1 Tax=Panagrolaimus sp. JU765 TaxID=591449 RepID=A0AC34QRE5_9BILA
MTIPKTNNNNLLSIPTTLIGPNGEEINKENIPIQLLSSATLPPSLPGAPLSGCPPTSQPLLNGETRLPYPCSTTTKCPESFTCYSNYPDGRNAQCCTTMLTNEDETFTRAMRPSREPIKVCPVGFIKLGATCKRSKEGGREGREGKWGRKGEREGKGTEGMGGEEWKGG